MSRTYDLVIFDLDGTLCDTAPDIERCLNRAMREFGLPEVPHDRVLKAIGPGGRAFYRAILPEDIVERGQDYLLLAEKVVERYRSYYTENSTELTKPFPGIVETLEELGRLGALMGVASNKPQEQTRKIVAELGLSRYFLEVIGPESVEHSKPEPDMPRLIMERADVAPGRTLMVGDTDNDMNAGRAAGATTVFATWGYMTQGEIDDRNIDLVIASPQEIMEIVVGDAKPATETAKPDPSALNAPLPDIPYAEQGA